MHLQKKTLKGKRDRAILSVLAYHGLRREELSKLKVKDYYVIDKAIPHFRVTGKGDKKRYIPIHPVSIRQVNEYLEFSKHGKNIDDPLFLTIRNGNISEGSEPLDQENDNSRRMINPNAIQRNIVRYYAEKSGIYFIGFSPHALRKTAATKAFDNNADIKRVKDWLGHSNISTTQIYDARGEKPEDSPTFKITY